jgi:hypothetical protein
MSHTLSVLAMIAIRPNKEKNKNVTHAVWSGHLCRRAKKKEKQKISCMPSGLAVALFGKKKEKQKMSRTQSGLAVVAIGPK